MTRKITCECGYSFTGETDDELWDKAEQHIRTDHPDLVGKVDREELLATAKEV